MKLPLDSIRIRTLALALALLSPLTSSAGDEATRLRSLVDRTIRPLMAEHQIPGMSVALTIDGQSHVFSYGVASLQSRAPVTESTIFEIGSISKMFTATLAAYAQATGKLSLDHHPGQYIPRLQGRPIDQATLLHLGTYTAGGLPLQFPDEVGGDEAALAYLQGWQTQAPPGTVRHYSNPSIGLLGAVTAVALNDRFATLMETQILLKFGMRQSYIRVPTQAMGDYAWGHRKGKAVRVKPGPMDEPAYGIKSTVQDMIRFVQANIDPSELDATLRRAVESTQVGQFRVNGMVQGFGWEQFPYPLSRELLLGGHAEDVIFETNPVQPVPAQAATEPRLFNKTGSTGGFAAYVVFVPAKRIGLVMLANRSYPIPARVEAAYTILRQLAPGPR